MAFAASKPALIELAKAVLDIIESCPDDFEGMAGVPVPGSNALFEQDAFLKEMVEQNAEYKGRAHTLFSVCCDAHAMRNVQVSMHDVSRYRDEHFSQLSGKDVVRWKHAITVAVTADTVDAVKKMEPGAPVLHLFRKISMDVMIYAFFLEFWERLNNHYKHHGATPTNFWDAARHVPINFVYFEPGADFEQEIYVHAMQIMEDFRSSEETHAPRAWALCQMWAEARRMQTNSGDNADDGVAGTVALLSKIKYSKHSDYVDKATRSINKRLLSDGLVLHERAVAADVGDILEQAGVLFGTNTPLSSMSKLVKLSQMVTAASQSRKSDPSRLLRMTVQLMFMRLRLNLTSPGEGISTLAKTEIPRCMLVAEMFTAGLGKVSLEGEPQHVTEFLLTSLNAVPGKASMLEQLAKEAVRPSARGALTWTHSLLIGNLDIVLKEIVHQNFKTKTIDELMSHAKLGFTEAVMDKLSLEAEEAKRRQLAQLAEDKNLSAEMLEDLSNALDGKDTAAAGLISEGAAPTPVAIVAVEPTSAQEAEPDTQEADPAAQLAQAREIFVTSLAKQYVRLAKRPAVDDDAKIWQDTIADLIEGFFAVARGGTSCHAWIVDPAADSEPALQPGEGIWARSPPVNKAMADAFFRAAGRVSVSQRDASCVAMSFAPLLAEHATATITKILGGEFFDSMQADHLAIVYKEQKKSKGQRRSRTHVVERCLAFVSKTASAAMEIANSKGCTRMALTGTSTMSDAILNAPRRGDTPDEIHGGAASLRTKLDVLGETGLLRGEAAELESHPNGPAILFHQEKLQSLWREILHHYHVSTLCTATPGCGDVLIAAFDLGIPAAALCKSDVHLSFLQDRLAKHILQETMNPESQHYQSDYALAKSCELSERVLAIAEAASAEQAEQKDEGTEGENEKEEEEDGEEEEEAEEEVEEEDVPQVHEEEEVEEEVDEIEIPVQTVKQNVKGNPKAKAKAEAKPKADPKAQQKKAEAKAKKAVAREPKAKKAAAGGQLLTKRVASASPEPPTMTPKSKRNRREVTSAGPLAKV